MRMVLSVLFLLFAVNSPAFSAERFGEFGTKDDYDPGREIFFPGQPDNYWFWGMSNPKKFIQYETEDKFWWVTRPRIKGRAIGARVLKSHHYGKIRVKEIPGGGNKLHLVIRFKDNLLAPVSLWAAGSSDYFSIGSLGGKNDHYWKSAVLPVDRKKLAVKDGRYEFRISRGDYGDLKGDLPIDWIRLSELAKKPEPASKGFWPRPAPTRFPHIGRNMIYRAGGKARFITGVMIKGMRQGSWDEFAKAGLNHVNLQAWEFNWKRRWEVYADSRFADRVRFGFPDWNEACASAGVGCSVQFFTDTRSYWIEKQYGNEEQVLQVIEEVVRFNRKSRANMVWYPIDEADHEDATWGAPVEFAMQVTERIRRADPDTPILMLFQAWKPGVYEMYRDSFDVAAFDVYPLGSGRDVKEIADRADAMRKQLGDTKALWAVVEGQDGLQKRKLEREEILVQGYLAITHGIQGVLFFLDAEGTYLDMSDIPKAWSGIKQFSTEITSPINGIESFLVPPAEVIDIMGKSGRVRVSREAIHYTLRRRGDGLYALIAVNTSRKHLPRVRFFCRDLRAGAKISVRFEERSLRSGPQVIVDDFAPFERHVYTFRLDRRPSPKIP